MLKKILPILLALTILLSACGAQGTPTMAPADVQNTAVAAAWTVVAMTQAAIPTATQIPPTETPSPTPLPTFTAEPLIVPTLEPIILPTNTSLPADPNNCNKPLDMGAAGPTKNVRIENENKSQVNLSLFLYTPNEFGQCGYISYVVNKNEKRRIEIPSGYWSASAWVLDPPSTPYGSFYIGPSKTQDLLRLIIKKDTIVWVGP
jgi:hypothetical protein